LFNAWPEEKKNQTHTGEKPYEETVFIEEALMVQTHQETITRLMSRMVFGLRRDPLIVPEV